MYCNNDSYNQNNYRNNYNSTRIFTRASNRLRRWILSCDENILYITDCNFVSSISDILGLLTIFSVGWSMSSRALVSSEV